MNVLNKARVCECLPGHYSLTPPLPSPPLPFPPLPPPGSPVAVARTERRNL